MIMILSSSFSSIPKSSAVVGFRINSGRITTTCIHAINKRFSSSSHLVFSSFTHNRRAKAKLLMEIDGRYSSSYSSNTICNNNIKNVNNNNNNDYNDFYNSRKNILAYNNSKLRYYSSSSICSSSSIHNSNYDEEDDNNHNDKSKLGSFTSPKMKVSTILSWDEDENNKVNNCSSLIGKMVTINGWVRTFRKQKNFGFLEINDGSCLGSIQVIVDKKEMEKEENIVGISTGCSIKVSGILKESPGKGQKYELEAKELTLIGAILEDEKNKYPLQKKRHTLEHLRSIAHLRPRTNTISSVARLRSKLAFACHTFFQKEGFTYLQTPIITGSDCEGAGEAFQIKQQGNKTIKEEEFFGKPAYLTVSGQLSAEAYACAMGDVYTMGPTFRAENSHTSRHLAEFTMLEPEMAFADLNDNMNNAESFMKFIIKEMLNNCREELEFFEKFYEKNLISRLEKISSSSEPFVRMSYTEAIDLLQKEIGKKNTKNKWEYPNVTFGTDLQSEHERWLCEVASSGKPTFIYNYPRDIKAFYMRDNDDGKTVAAMDLLVPGVGEIIGGSQREERLHILEDKMKEFDLNKDDYWWYLDLRRYGSVPHSGYGVGFERLVCYLTGIKNIRDAIAFPRYPGNAEF